LHSGSTKLLKDLEEDIEVEDVSKVGETVGEENLGAIIAMSRDISLEIFLFSDVLGVAIVETTPMPPENFHELIAK
jgi:hypothetical protein